MSTSAERWLFVGFMIAFAVKAPLFPLHTWLADTTEKATPGTSVLLVCVLDKIGTFGMLRFCLGLFPEASQWATPVVVVLALISIVYGAFLAIGQDDILRLIGLTSLSHFGFITLGIFALTSQGASGSILYMVNHGIGDRRAVPDRRLPDPAQGHLADQRDHRRREQARRSLAGLFLVAGLATLGLPGLSQFVSEILVLIAAFDYHWWVGAVAVTGIVLAAIYVLWLYQRTMTGPPRCRATRAITDLNRRELGRRRAADARRWCCSASTRCRCSTPPTPPSTRCSQHVGVTDDAPDRARRGRRGRRSLMDFVKPTIEYAQLWPLLVVFGVACLGVVRRGVRAARAPLPRADRARRARPRGRARRHHLRRDRTSTARRRDVARGARRRRGHASPSTARRSSSGASSWSSRSAACCSSPSAGSRAGSRRSPARRPRCRAPRPSARRRPAASSTPRSTR